MAYGIEIYNDLGELQFDSEDPAMYFKSYAEATAIPTAFELSSGGTWTSWDFRGTFLGNIDWSDLRLCRPINSATTGGFEPASEGMVGMYLIDDVALGFGMNTWKIGTGFSMKQPLGIQYTSIKDPAGLQDNGGYGLTAYDINGNVTFTTDPAPPFLGYFEVVKFEPAGSSGGSSFPGKPIYTASTTAEFNSLYVVCNNNTCRTIVNRRTGPIEYNITVTSSGYYFRPSNRTIYASEFTFTTGWYNPVNYGWSLGDGIPQTTGPWGEFNTTVEKTLPTVSVTWPSTLTRNYMVVRPFPSKGSFS